MLSQSSSAGSELEKGSSVDVVVSDGSLAKVAVPGVVGKPQDEAEALIANAWVSDTMWLRKSTPQVTRKAM